MKLNSRARSILREMRNTISPRQIQIYMSLGDAFKVPWFFYYLIKRRVAEMTPFLLRDHAYRLDQLLGSDLWSALNSAERRMAKLSVTDLVCRGDIPLRFGHREADDAATYAVID